MDLATRISTFSALGEYIRQTVSDETKIAPLLKKAQDHNGWFTKNNVLFALNQWGNLLTPKTINTWLEPYELTHTTPKKVAVIMAGNIPLVGFHDFISVLIAGHHVVVKLSSHDKVLLPFLIEHLVEINPMIQDYITISEEKLPSFDAVIATGSNNTARYFDYYFRKYPNIIRKNRNGIAILDGKETAQDLEELSHDIFRYFGLGCRNISKIFIPKSYDFDPFFNAMFTWKELIDHNKYINNYDYNKAVYLMSDIPLLDNEFMLLKEDKGFASPISVVYYEYYDSLDQIQYILEGEKESIQCVVGNRGHKNIIPFGSSQTPALWEYADGIDTLRFLQSL